jgi:hypothetical protein
MWRASFIRDFAVLVTESGPVFARQELAFALQQLIYTRKDIPPFVGHLHHVLLDGGGDLIPRQVMCCNASWTDDHSQTKWQKQQQWPEFIPDNYNNEDDE